MNFVINSDARKKCGNGTDEYWFSYKDYKIKHISELSDVESPDATDKTSYFISLGLIPYINVTNEEIMRAIVETYAGEKLKDIFSEISSEDYVETFWKYYNVYPELAKDTDEFMKNYINKRIVSWCEENEIDYTVDND